jgi:hypothetical protein
LCRAPRGCIKALAEDPQVLRTGDGEPRSARPRRPPEDVDWGWETTLREDVLKPPRKLPEHGDPLRQADSVSFRSPERCHQTPAETPEHGDLLRQFFLRSTLREMGHC